MGAVVWTGRRGGATRSGWWWCDEVREATRSGWWWCSGDGGVDGAASGPPVTRAAGRWRPTRWGDGESGADVGASGGGGWRRRGGVEAALGRRRGGGAASRRRSSGVGRGEGKGIEGEGEKGIEGRGGKIWMGAQY